MACDFVSSIYLRRALRADQAHVSFLQKGSTRLLVAEDVLDLFCSQQTQPVVQTCSNQILKLLKHTSFLPTTSYIACLLRLTFSIVLQRHLDLAIKATSLFCNHMRLLKQVMLHPFCIPLYQYMMFALPSLGTTQLH